jgi:hypothetical protein
MPSTWRKIDSEYLGGSVFSCIVHFVVQVLLQFTYPHTSLVSEARYI